MYFKPSRKNKDFVFLPVSIPTSKQIIPASLFSFPLRIRDPLKDSMKINMEWFHQKLMEVMLENWLCVVLFTWKYYPLCLFLRPSLSVRQIWQLNFPRYVGWHHPRVGRDPWFGMQVFLSSEYYVYPLSTYLFTGSTWAIDVLWGQPIKLIQVASTYFRIAWKSRKTTFFSFKLFPVISAGPQKYKHKIGHN